MKHFVILPLLIFAKIVFSSNFVYDKQAEQTKLYILDFKFEKADSLIKNKNNAIYKYLNLYSLFIQNLLNGNNELYQKYKSDFEKSISVFEKIDKNDSLKNIILSELYFETSIIKMINTDFISGSFSFIKSYSYFQDSEKLFPKLKQNLKMSGIYKIIAGITPDNGKKFLNMIGLSGNIKSGYDKILLYKKYCKKNSALFYENIALVNLINTFLKDELNHKSIPKINTSLKQNNTVLFSEIIKNFKTGEYEQLNKNSELLLSQTKQKYPIVYYYLGITNTVVNKVIAEIFLDKFLSETRNKHFIKAAYWQKARIGILQSKIKKFEINKKLCLTKGESFTEADKQAENEAKNDIKLQKNLLQARLFFDIKEYKTALLIIKQIDPDVLKYDEQKAEYYYRLGRIYFEIKNLEAAKLYFLKVIKNFSSVKRYFIPFSALNLSYIYKQKNNKIKEKEMLILAKKLNNYEYKNSLKHKIDAEFNHYLNCTTK